jgi:excisionase family DNA binding protein
MPDTKFTPTPPPLPDDYFTAAEQKALDAEEAYMELLRDFLEKSEIRKTEGFQTLPDELLDITEVAMRLGVPRSTVYELTRSRAHVRHSHPLPAFKVGRRLKFRWSTVVAWLAELEKLGVR